MAIRPHARFAKFVRHMLSNLHELEAINFVVQVSGLNLLLVH